MNTARDNQLLAQSVVHTCKNMFTDKLHCAHLLAFIFDIALNSVDWMPKSFNLLASRMNIFLMILVGLFASIGGTGFGSVSEMATTGPSLKRASVSFAQIAPAVSDNVAPPSLCSNCCCCCGVLSFDTTDSSIVNGEHTTRKKNLFKYHQSLVDSVCPVTPRTKTRRKKLAKQNRNRVVRARFFRFFFLRKNLAVVHRLGRRTIVQIDAKLNSTQLNTPNAILAKWNMLQNCVKTIGIWKTFRKFY